MSHVVDPHEAHELRMQIVEAVDGYTFTQWLETTALLQIIAYGRDPRDLVEDDGHGQLTEEGAEFFRWNVLAAQAELVELLNEAGWKPWATSRHFNREQIIGEAVDALHFIANLLRMTGCTGHELSARYRGKQLVNLDRQIASYDGVTGKCRVCKRDLAESRCTPTTCSGGDC